MRPSLFPPCYLLVPLLWLFRRPLFAGELFAFRDAAHFYGPLHRYVQARWWQGLPLWNPLDGIGQPLMGDPTATVWYPGQVIFLLPLPYAVCFSLFLVAHLWLGGYGTFRLARDYRASWYGSLVAGLCFELSGHVLFQYSNPIYCVGAAWCPWAVLYLRRFLAPGSSPYRHRGGTLWCAVLSMMVLGGDPYMAYCVLLLGLFQLVSGCGNRRGRQTVKMLGGLAGTAVVVALLCAAQLLPTCRWASRSDRALRDGPRSAVELIADGAMYSVYGGESPTFEGFWKRPAEDSHAAHIYDFSVGPWRWLELVWPNVTGIPFPTHQRWLKAFAGEARFWTPSLYLGVVPLLLSLCRIRWLRGSQATRSWTWAVTGSALAAMGAFGAGWLLNECRYLWSPDTFEESVVLPGFGGVYWMMNVLLPGHIHFRYPAKLWTITTLGICLLAAKGWSVIRSQPRWFGRITMVLGGVSVTGAAVAATPWIYGELSRVPPNLIFGPMDVTGAQTAFVVSFVHTACVSIAIAMALRMWSFHGVSRFLVVLTAVEVTVAQRHLVQTIPSRQVPASISQGETLYRCAPQAAYPRTWRDRSSARRCRELYESDLSTLMPKHHLTFGARSIQSSVPLSCADYSVLAAVARDRGQETSQSLRAPDRAWVNLLGATHLFVPDDAAYVSSADSQVAGPFLDSPVVHYRNRAAFPRTWLVHQWSGKATYEGHHYSTLVAHTNEVMLKDGLFRDFRHEAVVESDPNLPLPRPPAARETAAGDGRCVLTLDAAERVVIDVSTDKPALLVLADQYYPGWEVWVGQGDGNATRREVRRVNRVMRGVFLEAGEHTVEFRYRPWDAYAGMLLSAVAWLTWLGVVRSPRSRG